MLYAGKLEAGKTLLESALQAAPEDPIASAVMIDGQILTGALQQARESTARLLERRPLPPWLVDHLHA
ncbi:MAG: tetratricopeptide repeat protein, partial [Anaerolineales bacterium]